MCRWFFQRLVDEARASLKSWAGFKTWIWSQVPPPWTLIVIGLMSHFVIGCIEQFAQSHAAHAHNQALLEEAHQMEQSNDTKAQ